MNLDLDALRTFLAVAELRSFTQAAQRVARTQSAVSMQVKNLEERLGFELFQRTKRSVALTSDGERLVVKAREILRVHDESVRELTGPKVQGRLRLGVTEYFVPEHLPGLLLRFVRQYPDLEVEITTGITGALRELQKAGQLDLVIGRRDAGATGGIVLRQEKLRWVAAKSFQLSSQLPLPLALLPPGCGVRSQALAVLNKSQRAWRPIYCGPSVWGLQAVISAGLAIGCLTQSAVLEEFKVLGSADSMPSLEDSEIVLFLPGGKAKSQVQGMSKLVQDYFSAVV